MGEKKQPEPITKPKLLLVEGKDEVNLFNELIETLGLINDIQTIEVGGKNKFEEIITRLKKAATGFNKAISIGIIRDADDNPGGAFQSVCSVLGKVQLPKPKAPLLPIAGPPQVTVMIVPDENSTGMIENVCLDSVSDDPAMPCVDNFLNV